MITYIYFITEGFNNKLKGSSCVKIGVANDPFYRAKQLQTGNPKMLEVAVTIGPMGEAQAYDIESRFHKLLKRYQVSGEWFTSMAIRCLNDKPRFLPESMKIKVYKTSTGHHGLIKLKQITDELEAMRQAEMETVANARAAGL